MHYNIFLEQKGKSLGQCGYERFFNSLKCFIPGAVANQRSAMARVRSLQDWISTQHDQKMAAEHTRLECMGKLKDSP